ncbi:hypothetical protein Pcar_0294 [Syntrophotalea carbinolica DSM 2380]|uniref:Uncharacterized protein n=1 Tax=Syntrophotalea carbinolica (strain DSM 2380 / NBRC 103641 / GraBd1) TaxID=338963 RepID=Q3A7U0_SYNC1|nr:metallophosphoesterase [Syntrophotalea carbinolica]ABA87554.1 hypothetical protein Pcar_0294 [Syntrophotalea carbinolica DSM 2380]
MKIAILHLSDIHLRDKKEDILNKAELIASSFFVQIRDSSLVLILITGDIAYSGEGDQYNLALNFFEKIKSIVKSEKNINVDIIVSPGNHDCKLDKDDIVRESVIEKINKDESHAENIAVIQECTKVQSNFFEFQEIITESTPLEKHNLFCEYKYTIGDREVRVTSVNASWMSSIAEKQGSLIYPQKFVSKHLEEESSLRILLLHHPLNWYSQSTYHPLKNLLRAKSDIILSGHEHCVSSGLIDEKFVGKSLFFEAGALNPHEKDKNRWSVISIDLGKQEVVEERYAIDGFTKLELENKSEMKLDLSGKEFQHLDLTEEFKTTLKDPGALFSRPDKEKVNLESIFVFPELEERIRASRKARIFNAETVFGDLDNYKRVLFLGEEKAGKTVLILRGFSYLHSQGYAPLYLRAKDLSSVSEKSLRKDILLAAKSQYCNPEEYERISKRKKVAMLDDLDFLKGGGKAQYSLISYLENNFDSVILTAEKDFEINELIDSNIKSILEKYSIFEIRPFGHKLRYELIRKWCISSGVNTKKDLDQKLHDIERVLNSVIGKNLVPRKPIYLLILLQSCNGSPDAELKNSSFAYYYQYLFTKNLSETGVKPEQLHELFFYLTNLSWFFHCEKSSYLTEEKLIEFNRQFSDEFTTVDFKYRIELLCDAFILKKHGNLYKFSYPYVYYYFVGKYLSENIDQLKVREFVEECIANLHIRKNANFVLFLTHHQNSPLVIDLVEKSLVENLKDAIPIEYGKDIDSINNLVDSVSELIMEDTDVDQNQKKSRGLVDEIELHDEENDEEDIDGGKESEADDVDDVVEIVNRYKRLTKTAEILGQILKNYYGSIKRDRKIELIKEVFDGPLRMQGSLYKDMLNDPGPLVKEIESFIDFKGKNLDKDKKRIIAKKICFRILGLVSTSLIHQTAIYVCSDDLKEEIGQAVKSSKTIAYRLLEAAVDLSTPGFVNAEKLSNLSKTLSNNPFAFTMLQTLVLYHLHMFHTDFRVRQKLCQSLKIEMSTSRHIDVNSKDRKIL